MGISCQAGIIHLVCMRRLFILLHLRVIHPGRHDIINTEHKLDSPFSIPNPLPFAIPELTS